jgi:hypothetical protein
MLIDFNLTCRFSNEKLDAICVQRMCVDIFRLISDRKSLKFDIEQRRMETAVGRVGNGFSYCYQINQILKTLYQICDFNFDTFRANHEYLTNPQHFWQKFQLFFRGKTSMQ